MRDTSRSAVCEKTRVWAALSPDGELSVFERRLLDAHSVRCPECRRLRDDIGSVTAIVRATPLDEMSCPVRVSSHRLPSWRPAVGVLLSGGAAVLALVLAVWIGPQARTIQVTTRIIDVPAIVATPELSGTVSKPIWDFKRSRGAVAKIGVEHRTGLVLN